MIFDEGLQFISLSSGSNGNCYYIGNDSVSLLIDAGLGCRTLKKRLAEYMVDISNIDAVFITHDHIDHIRHLSTLIERFGKPVFTTRSIHKALENHPCTRGSMCGYNKNIEKEIPYNLKGISVTPFEVIHDATDTVGYYIEFGEEKFTLITDIGRVTDTVERYCRMANHLIIEANYDEELLEKGSYPQFLKNRIKNGTGHLSNDATAETIKRVYHKDLKNIFLCHLSENNNTPKLAFDTVSNALAEIKISVGNELNLYVLPRQSSYCINVTDYKR